MLLAVIPGHVICYVPVVLADSTQYAEPGRRSFTARRTVASCSWNHWRRGGIGLLCLVLLDKAARPGDYTRGAIVARIMHDHSFSLDGEKLAEGRSRLGIQARTHRGSGGKT